MVATEYLYGGATGALILSTGALIRYMLRPLRPFAVPILRYRFIGPPIAGSPYNPLRVNGPTLHQHINYLARRDFKLVTLGEALDNHRDKRFLASNPVVLTFDGAYASLLRYVYPALEEFGFNKATLFAAPETLGGNNSFETGGRGRPEMMLTESGLRELADFGFEIGSLGKRGTDLSKLSHQELLADLSESREKLSQLSGQNVDLLAYPRDAQISHAQVILKQAGYRAASWISLQGLLEKGSETFRLPRYPISRKSKLIEVALVLAQRLA